MTKSTKKKVRPPRIYTHKKTGRKYIKKDGRKYYLNFGKKADKLESVELLKLFLKHLGKPKARQSKKASKRVIISDFNRLEHENRNQVNNQIDRLRQEKYIKIHEAEAAEERAKKKQQQDAQDREEDIKRQTNRERLLLEDLKEEKNRRAMFIPAAPPMIDSRAAPRYTDDEIKQGIKMLEESKRKIREQTLQLGLDQMATQAFRAYSLHDIGLILKPYGYKGPLSSKSVKKKLTEFFLNTDAGKKINIGNSSESFHKKIAELEKKQNGKGRSIVHDKISESFTTAKIRKLLDKKDWMWKMTKPVLIDILMTKMGEFGG